MTEKVIRAIEAALAQAADAEEYADIMNRFLEGADQYGIQFITGRPEIF